MTRLHPLLGDNLLAGMKLYLDHTDPASAGLIYKVLDQKIGIGPGDALAGTRKLIQVDHADVVVGPINPLVAPRLQSLLQESGVPFVVAESGSTIIRLADRSPHVFHRSLGYWQSSWAMGDWAASHLGQKAFLATSFYESGFDAHYAFRHGFEKSGGEILGVGVTHGPSDANDMATVIDRIDRSRPDFVFASYSGEDAVSFVRAFADSGLARRIPLVGAGFLTDEAILPRLGPAALGIKTAFSWAVDLPTPENQSFTTAFERVNGRAADAFAFLGYSAARLIRSAVQPIGMLPDRSDRFLEALRSGTLASPSGQAESSPKGPVPSSSIYLREVRGTGATLRNKLVASIGQTSDIDSWGEWIRGENQSGWLNPHLSV